MITSYTCSSEDTTSVAITIYIYIDFIRETVTVTLRSCNETIQRPVEIDICIILVLCVTVQGQSCELQLFIAKHDKDSAIFFISFFLFIFFLMKCCYGFKNAWNNF